MTDSRTKPASSQRPATEQWQGSAFRPDRHGEHNDTLEKQIDQGDFIRELQASINTISQLQMQCWNQWKKNADNGPVKRVDDWSGSHVQPSLKFLRLRERAFRAFECPS